MKAAYLIVVDSLKELSSLLRVGIQRGCFTKILCDVQMQFKQAILLMDRSYNIDSSSMQIYLLWIVFTLTAVSLAVIH